MYKPLYKLADLHLAGLLSSLVVGAAVALILESIQQQCIVHRILQSVRRSTDVNVILAVRTYQLITYSSSKSSSSVPARGAGDALPATLLSSASTNSPDKVLPEPGIFFFGRWSATSGSGDSPAARLAAAAARAVRSLSSVIALPFLSS